MAKRELEDASGVTSTRRHQRNFEQSSSRSYLTAMTTITIAATCFLSSTYAFTSSSPGSRTSHDNRISNRSPFASEAFGIRTTNSPVDSSTRIFAASSGSDKEEWRAILAAFQMYKAAYGDLKVPTRFVVPAMAPWPGKFHSSCVAISSLFSLIHL